MTNLIHEIDEADKINCQEYYKLLDGIKHIEENKSKLFWSDDSDLAVFIVYTSNGDKTGTFVTFEVIKND